MTVIELVPPLQLLNVLPVTVRLIVVLVVPSLFEIPLSVVAPVTVMLEKLLFEWLMLVAETELAPDVITVTVPPAPVLLKAVTIELPLIV